MSKNISYQTNEISDFYSKNRIKWLDFYESERKVFETVGLGKDASVLDLGCGCGGLGFALKERFGIKNYTGIDINKTAINIAKSLNPEGNFINSDIADLKADSLKSYDFVFCLGTIDWNIEFDSMLKNAWSLVGNGNLIVSIRLTEEAGVFNNLKESFQYINFSGSKEGEIAPYNIFNFYSWLNKIKKLPNLSEIYAYGYYGKPSSTALTIYEKVCFSVFSLSKNNYQKKSIIENIDLPENLIKSNLS